MRRRILALTLSTTFLVVLAFVVPLAFLVRSVTTDDARARLQQQAQATALAVRASWTVQQLQDYVDTQDADRGTSTRVDLGGTTVGSLPSGVALPSGLPTGGPGDGDDAGRSSGGGPGPGVPGSTRPVSGGEIAVGFNRDARAVVIVFESDDALAGGATRWYLLLTGAGLVLLGLSALAAVVVSRRISAPLSATAEAAHRLSAGDIEARAPVTGPREVAEVGAALNRLAGRIDELVDEERETVADLSHRMRTPLTALRLDADTLADPEEAERIGGHVASLERTLTAVIRSARRAEREGIVPAADATAVVGERTAFWSALAEDQGRAVEVVLPPRPVAVRAAASDLAAAVDALVENVLAHTPEGVAFRVALTATTTGATLEVTDGGPGLPPGAGVRGRSDRGSTGLGLSIAARVAEGSGGSIALDTPAGGGARVVMTLGAP